MRQRGMSDSEHEDVSPRYRRRTWNRRKSYLPKHTSLPELHLLPAGRRPLFHCQRCGFINTLIPLCLWCTWTSQEAEHEFESSTPRARRVSAPAKVFFHIQMTMTMTSTSPQSQSQKYPAHSPHGVLEHLEPHDLMRTLIGSPEPSPLSTVPPMSSSLFSLSPQFQKQDVNSQQPLKKSKSIVSPCVSFGNAHPPSIGVSIMPTETVDLGDNDHLVMAGSSKGNSNSSVQRAKRLGAKRRENRDVPTATTPSVLAPRDIEIDVETSISRTTTTTDTVTSYRDPSLLSRSHSFASEEQVPAVKPLPAQSLPSKPPSPSPSSSAMKSMKSFRTLKSSRRMLNIDTHDATNADGDIKPRPRPHSIHVPGNPYTAAFTTDVDEHEHKHSENGLALLTRGSKFTLKEDGSKPSSPLPLASDISPPRQQGQSQLRTLRRKKHFNIMQSSIAPDPENVAAEPIAIALNLRASQRDLQRLAARSKSPLRPQSSNIQILPKRKRSRPLSIVSAPPPSESESSDLASPPLTPLKAAHSDSPSSLPTVSPVPPSTAPVGLTTTLTSPVKAEPAALPMTTIDSSTSTTPSSSPVKLGHPSRPYYSAIRKGGMGSTPPPSRPTSLSGPSPLSPSSSPTTGSRPKSYTPSTTTSASLFSHFSSAVSTPANASVASRHLSMSSMFMGSPVYPSQSSPLSVFSVLDDDDEIDAGNAVTEDGVLPSTPSPGLVSFSLAAASRRLSGSRTGQNPFPQLLTRSSHHGHGHRQTLSLASASDPTSNGSRSPHRNTIGFSMSGVTELRMALATASAVTSSGSGDVDDMSASLPRGAKDTREGFNFKFREREPTSLNQTTSSPDDVDELFGPASSGPSSQAGSRGSFLGRVRKLRKGLKEMMLLSSPTHD